MLPAYELQLQAKCQERPTVDLPVSQLEPALWSIHEDEALRIPRIDLDG
jgi:hypothetical protein